MRLEVMFKHDDGPFQFFLVVFSEIFEISLSKIGQNYFGIL